MIARRAWISSVIVVACLAVACGDDTAGSAGAVLQVAGDGLHTIGPDGEIDSTMFDTIEGDVRGAVAAVLGDPIDSGRLPECSPTAAYLTFPGLSITLSDGLFEGWTLRDDAEVPIETAEGVGLGSTLADLEALHGPVDVDTESSLGVEFSIGEELFGILDGVGPEATVEVLWAGDTCEAR